MSERESRREAFSPLFFSFFQSFFVHEVLPIIIMTVTLLIRDLTFPLLFPSGHEFLDFSGANLSSFKVRESEEEERGMTIPARR